MILHADGGHRDGRARVIDLPTYFSPSPSSSSGEGTKAWGATAARWRVLMGSKARQGEEDGDGGAELKLVAAPAAGGTRLMYYTKGGAGLSVLEVAQGKEGATHLRLQVRERERDIMLRCIKRRTQGLIPQTHTHTPGPIDASGPSPLPRGRPPLRPPAPLDAASFLPLLTARRVPPGRAWLPSPAGVVGV